MRAPFIFLLLLVARFGRAQHEVELTPMNFTAQNRFIIADVEDMRSVRKSIGQVSRGMLNTQVPAVLEYDLDAFIHSYLNAALNPEGAVAV